MFSDSHDPLTGASFGFVLLRSSSVFIENLCLYLALFPMRSSFGSLVAK
jgi:hypothetical protein